MADISLQKARIALIGCGGTMSSLGTSRVDMMDYPEYGKKITVQEVLDQVPEAADVAQVMAVPFRSVGSTAFTPKDWFELRDTIYRVIKEDPQVAGVVIIHGTATLEETAFFLDMTLGLEVPVVVVGAQRPISAIGSDAALNLLNGLRVAAAPASRGRGVLVVLNDEVHAARDVIKAATLRVNTFRSADFGVLGVVDPDGLHYYRRLEPRPASAPRFDQLPKLEHLPRVDIIYSYAGADGALVDAAVAAGAKGLISAGLAPGIAAFHQVEAFNRARAAGVVVVQCTRSPSGRVANRRHLLASGVISGEDFSPQKARILLALGLITNAETEALRALFQAY